MLAPPDDSRVMMRWWWFGPDLDRAEIDRELQAMADAGLGGAEVALVYPLRPGAPHYLSPEQASGRSASRVCRAAEFGSRRRLPSAAR